MKVPFLIKGVITAADARLCVERGASGIVVSNHGSRRVGHGCSSLEVLPEIADEVKGRIPVLVDSGFRRGSDVLKALALGANAVCLGRAPRWGLAAYGPAGVRRLLEIVQAELVLGDGQHWPAHPSLDRPQLGPDEFPMAMTWTRRSALESLGLWIGASPLLRGQDGAQKLIGEAPGRIAPRNELVNAYEMEDMARRSLASRVFAEIEGSGDRRPFDRVVFHPRVMVDVRNLDVTIDLLGTKMHAPILVGPASRLERFHPDGELALVRGASAAQATVVISDRSSQPVEKIAAEAKVAPWYQVYPEADMAPVLTRVRQAVKAGCHAVCVTIGSPYEPAPAGSSTPLKLGSVASPRTDWAILDQIRKASDAPVLLKGIMSPEEARTAVERGANGIVVSNYGGRFVHGLASPMEVLSAVVDAVGGKIPVLIDGGFRRGTDVIAALALGARAVLISRPALWGLAAYGAEGVQTVLEMLQSESARTMALCGKPRLTDLDRTLVRMDRR